LVNPLGQMGLAGHMAALLGFQPALVQAALSQVVVAFLASRTAISLGSRPALALAMLNQLVGGSDDSFDISFSIYTPTSSVRLPPNPNTQQFYPSISLARSPIVSTLRLL
jgi:hypothetical protein